MSFSQSTPNIPYCTSRKRYRSTKRPTAVKVYTINEESKYLLVENIPALGVIKDLLNICSTFGVIQDHMYLDELGDEFLDAYWIKFRSLMDAKRVKKSLDDYEFYGQLLRISYAPQYEEYEETLEKFNDRENDLKEVSSTLESIKKKLGKSFT